MDEYKASIIKYIIYYFEQLAYGLGANGIYIEVSKHDLGLKKLIDSLGYNCKKDLNQAKYPTYLMDKDIVRSDDYGRNLSRK